MFTTRKIYRVFASTYFKDGTLYKKHKLKDTLDKTTSTPEKCRIVNCDITEMETPEWLDTQWYIDLAKRKISEFI